MLIVYLIQSAVDKCGTTESGCNKFDDAELQTGKAVLQEVPKNEEVAIVEATVEESSIYDPSVIEAVVARGARVVPDLKEETVRASHIHHRSPQSPLSLMDLMTLGMRAVQVFLYKYFILDF